MDDDIEVPAERRFEPWIRPLSAVPHDPPPTEGALRQAARGARSSRGGGRVSDIREISTEPDSWSLKLFTLAGLWRAVAGGEKDETLQALALSFDPAGRIVRCIVCNAVVESGANMGLLASERCGLIPVSFSLCPRHAALKPDDLEMAVLQAVVRMQERMSNNPSSDWRLIVQNRDGSIEVTKPKGAVTSGPRG
jgi:hypothetical protein